MSAGGQQRRAGRGENLMEKRRWGGGGKNVGKIIGKQG